MGAKLITKHFNFKEEEIAAGKYNVWELIQPLWHTVSIYDGLEQYYQDLKPFSQAQRRLLALFWYDSEVCNGGHHQFFSNSTGIVWKDALDCMEMIGAGQYAQNLQKAVNLFGGSVPFEREERNAALDQLCQREGFGVFGEMDDFYYSEECIGQRMDEYVTLHPAQFVLQGNYPCYEF